MSLIGYAELKEITDEAPTNYPDRERLDEWWAERGIDHEGLVRFCVEDAADSINNVLPTLVGASVDERTAMAVSAGYGMSMEVGFILGWIAHERSKR